MSLARATICLVISLLSVASRCEVGGYEPAPNCANADDCPLYIVVQSQEEFEIRTYKNAPWVYAENFPYNSYNQAMGKGVPMLAAYFNGGNREHINMNTTYPVLLCIDNSIYHVYFYVPVLYRVYTPRSLNDEIGKIDLPWQKYAAVKRFDGVISDVNIWIQIDALRKSLESSPFKQAAAEGRFFVASYNSLGDVNKPVNEVMIWFD